MLTKMAVLNCRSRLLNHRLQKHRFQPPAQSPACIAEGIVCGRADTAQDGLLAPERQNPEGYCVSAGERTWHIHDSQGQILALAFW